MKTAEGEREKFFTTSTTTNFHHAYCLLVRLYTYCVPTNTCIIITNVIYNIVAIDKISVYS